MKVLSSCFSNMRYRVLLILAGLLLFVIYLPYLNEDFFIVDDASLVSIPQFQNCSLKNFFSGFLVPGYHIDYYPLRELSYMFDRCLSGFNFNGISGTWYRVHNLLLFLGSVLFLFESLKKLKIKENIAFFSMLVVLWNPFFNESYLWISARKDILAVFFMSASVYFFLKAMEVRRNKFFYFSLMFYAFSLLSKATFVLLPFAFLVLFHLKNKIKERNLVIVGSLLGLSWAFFQKYFYFTYNNMSYNYSLEYKLKATLITLGKVFLGFFWDSFNSIDTANWGEWVSINRFYIYPGVMFVLLASLIFCHFLKSKNYLGLFTFLLVVALWAPISGLFFKHRNFYSTRYYMPILIWICPFLIGYGFKYLPKRFGFFLFFLLPFFFLIQTLSSSYNKWASNVDLLKHSLKISPDNFASQTFLAEELLNQKIWGRLNYGELQYLDSLVKDLELNCINRIVSRDTLCSVFFFSYALGKFSALDNMKNLNKDLVSKYESFMLELVSFFVPNDIDKVKFKFKNYFFILGINPGFEFHSDHPPVGSFVMPGNREFFWVNLCKKDFDEANVFLKNMIEKNLIYELELKDVISQVKNDQTRRMASDCYKKYKNQKKSFNN